MSKQYGVLCPEGHGVTLERDEWTRKGVVWCPDSGHGGNGRFYRRSEVDEGWFSPGQRHRDHEADSERSTRLAALEQQRKEIAMAKAAAAQKAKEPAAPRTRKGKDPKECKCGCGGMTKGGIFLPGHDARYHSRLAAEARAKAAK